MLNHKSGRMEKKRAEERILGVKSDTYAEGPKRPGPPASSVLLRKKEKRDTKRLLFFFLVPSMPMDPGRLFSLALSEMKNPKGMDHTQTKKKASISLKA